MKKIIVWLTFVIVLSACSGSGTSMLDSALNIDRSIPTKMVKGKTVQEINQLLISVFSGHGYTLSRQSDNLVKFTRPYSGALDFLAFSAKLKQHEELICTSISGTENNVVVQCKSFNVVTGDDPARDEQTHVKRIRVRIDSALMTL